MKGECVKRRYTVIGYLDLHEIHPVFEHITGCHAKCAVYRFKRQLRREHSEYRKVMEEYEPLHVIAVFRGHLKRRTSWLNGSNHSSPAPSAAQLSVPDTP